MGDVMDANEFHRRRKLLPKAPMENPGNGAREALIEIGKNCPFHVPDDVAIHWADDVLMRLWKRGFKVTPLDGVDEVQG